MDRQEIRLVPIILCGGGGTRLWPLSRISAPKPFLPLIGEETSFQRTLERVRPPLFSGAIVVTGSAHVDLVDRQVGDAPIQEILVEPQPRGTAAAIGIAASRLSRDSILVVCPSDHHIDDDEAFAEAAAKAATIASGGWLVCLGVKAQSAETRFGYIRRGASIGSDAFQIQEFVEKPNADTAEAFFASGQFAWNSGIFIFRAGDYLDELKRLQPEAALAVAQSVEGGRAANGHFYPEESAFARIATGPVDRAIMEKTGQAALVMVDAGWSDVGDWRALYSKRPKDTAGNSVRGPAELLDCRNVLVDSDGPRVHLLGLEDVIVVVEGDDILIAKVAQADNVSKLRGARQR